MSRGRLLPDGENTAIDGLLRENLSPRKMVTNISQSKTAVQNYCNANGVSKPHNMRGRPRKVTPLRVRALDNFAQRPGMAAHKVLRNTGALLSIHTVPRRLRKHEFIEFVHLAAPQTRTAGKPYELGGSKAVVQDAIYTTPKGMTLQQDGTPAHTSKYTRDFLIERLSEMYWAPRLSDMNCIKNCWSVLSRA